MLIRMGHVTNSSSTTHIIMWKGEKEALRNLLEAHSRRFELSYDSYEDGIRPITAKEVIDIILSFIGRAVSADSYNLQLEHSLMDSRRWRKEHKTKYLEDYYDKEESGLQDLSLRTKSFDWVLEVGFGDNHGDVCGTDVGIVMDYVGRNIRIVGDTIYYTTCQDR